MTARHKDHFEYEPGNNSNDILCTPIKQILSEQQIFRAFHILEEYKLYMFFSKLQT